MSGVIEDLDLMLNHIETFKLLARLYATVRNTYADRAGYTVDLAYQTSRLVKENVTQYGLARS
ncbi:MAG: hypothetical protein H0V43_09895 [Gemmatimonadales bacterium]|nr:hypothetical protein [Gemmatimonadales bacterium]